ncbi:Integral Membrane Protein [Bacteroidales bacterium CF]|jgi:Predicted membrane protein|nr:Integral Membrane Protein [Bacteroidales bacterium CF]
MANPVLSEKIFKTNQATSASTGTMTVKGTATKSLVLILMILAGAMYTWKIAYEAINPASLQPWMWGGVIGGFVVAMIISFKPIWAQYLAPIYAVLEGLFLGAISAVFSQAFAATAPGIVMNATLLTILTAVVMLIIYRTNLIKVDGKFAKIMTIAIGAIALYYIVSMVLSLFGVNLTMLHNSGPLSIGISLVIIGVAAFSLLMDYEFIVRASESGAPKYMEWYGAFGLMVTLVWLYLEILKILAKFAGNRE